MIWLSIPEQIEHREVDQDFVEQLMDYMSKPIVTRRDRPFPPFVNLGGHTTMKLTSEKGQYGYYYRPAGAWGAHAIWEGDVLVCHFPAMPHLHGEVFEEITEEDFMRENEGYK